MEETDIPTPPTLIRHQAEVTGNTAIIDDIRYSIQDYQGIQFVTINRIPYNLINGANGRFVIMNGTNIPAIGGRRSRRTKRSKRRSRRV